MDNVCDNFFYLGTIIVILLLILLKKFEFLYEINTNLCPNISKYVFQKGLSFLANGCTYEIILKLKSKRILFFSKKKKKQLMQYYYRNGHLNFFFVKKKFANRIGK